MALPINVEDLLNKQKIESNRIEFKRGWNLDKIYHTICAFATYLDNTGGGYILVGVEQDDNGMAKRPVKGLPIEDIDDIMQDMVGYDAKITTSNLRSIAYNSRVSKEEVDGKYILVIWVPTGPNRPYCVPESVITIEPTHIDILSYAGPDRSISSEAIKAARKLKARRYRNRRLGDFLKELDLTEGQATGIPTIQKALKDNGSSPAVIDTDDERTYFLMTIPCRDGFINEDVNTAGGVVNDIGDGLRQILGQNAVQVQEHINQSIITDKVQLGQVLEQLFVQVWNSTRSKDNATGIISATIDLLCMLYESSLSANELSIKLDYTSTKDLKRKILSPLIELNYIEMTIPDKPQSAKQAYRLTTKGESLFNLEKL